MLHEKEITLVQRTIRACKEQVEKCERKYQRMLKLGCDEESLKYPLREKAAFHRAVELAEKELRQLVYEQRHEQSSAVDDVSRCVEDNDPNGDVP